MVEIAEKIETKKSVKSKKRSVDTWKRKKWFSIHSPKIFGENQIEETIAEKPELLIGRTISPSLREIGANPKRSFYNVQFKISNVSGLKAATNLSGHELKPSFLKRFIRRRASKIEITQFVSTKDNVKIKVKTVILTERKASAIQKTAIRKIASEMIAGDAKKIGSEKFIYDLVLGEYEPKIKKAIRNISFPKKVEVIQSKTIEGK